MKKVFSLISFFLILMSMSCTSVRVDGDSSPLPELESIPRSERPRVVVADFSLSRRVYGYGYSGIRNLQTNLATRLESELINSHRFSVVDRSRMKNTLEEQDFGESGRVEEGSAPKIGKIKGAQIRIEVKVLELSTDGGAIGIATRRGALGIGKRSYTVELNIRAVDITTSEVILSRNISAVATSWGIAGARVFSHRGRRYWMAGGGFYKTPIGEAVNLSLKKAVYFLAKSARDMR